MASSRCLLKALVLIANLPKFAKLVSRLAAIGWLLVQWPAICTAICQSQAVRFQVNGNQIDTNGFTNGFISAEPANAITVRSASLMNEWPASGYQAGNTASLLMILLGSLLKRRSFIQALSTHVSANERPAS